MHRVAFHLLLVATLVCFGACDGDGETTSTGNNTSDAPTDATGDTAGGGDVTVTCVPDEEVACPCPNNSVGVKHCNEAGDGYGPCFCTGSTSGADTTSASDVATTSDVPATTDGLKLRGVAYLGSKFDLVLAKQACFRGWAGSALKIGALGSGSFKPLPTASDACYDLGASVRVVGAA